MPRTLRQLLWPIGVLALYYGVLHLVPAWTAPGAPPEIANECSRFVVQARESRPAADIPLLERCAAADPEDPGIARDLADAYEGRQQWTVAERWYRRALAIDADDADVHVRLGQLLLRRQDAAGALAQAAAALQTQPGGQAALSLTREARGGP